MTAALQKAEDSARLLRAELAEKEAAAAELTVRVDAAEAGVAARAKREEALESLLANQKAALVAAEERAAGLGRQLDGLQSLASAQQQAEKGELVQEIAVQERQLRGHAEREAALLSELEAAKRTQGEAEGAVGQLQLDVKHEQARVLAALQKAEQSEAELAPLRRQAEEATAAVGVFEGRLREATAALAEKEAALAEAKAQLLQLGQIDLRDKAERVKELQAKLLQAEAEVHGWADRQRQLTTELQAEREARRLAAAELAEAQESLASTRSLLVGTKDEQIAAAHAQVTGCHRYRHHLRHHLLFLHHLLTPAPAPSHAQINTLEGTVGALKARVATAEEHGGIQREELRMRVEQVRTTAGSNAPTHAASLSSLYPTSDPVCSSHPLCSTGCSRRSSARRRMRWWRRRRRCRRRRRMRRP